MSVEHDQLMSTTADIYTHPSDESQRRASRALGQVIFGDLLSNVLNSENRNSRMMVN